MNRKNYAAFISLPGNEVSTQTMMGAAKSSEDVDANMIFIPMGMLGVDQFFNNKIGTFRYQYNTLTRFFDSKSIDGAIIEYGMITSPVNADQKREFLSLTGDMPVVLLAESAEGYDSICFDNLSGFRDSIVHMIEVHHCSRIGMVSGPLHNQDARERLTTFWEVIKAYNLNMDESYVTYGDFSLRTKQCTTDLLDRHPDIECIIYANDAMALAGYDALRKRHLVPGKDILLSGFDNLPACQLKEIPLSSVTADVIEMAYESVQKLAKKSDLRILPTRFIPRQSCGCGENGFASLEEASEARATFLSKLDEVEQNKKFFDELDLLSREMIYHLNASGQWLDSALTSFDRINCSECYVFFYENASIMHKIDEPFEFPEKLVLGAYSRDGEHHVFVDSYEYYDTATIFNSDLFDSEERYNMVVTPLFFREKLMGLIFAKCNVATVQFVYQMATQLSNTIEMIHIQEDNERIKNELIYANQAKSNFLANMSHEIRTPINAIMGMDEMVLRESSEAPIVEYAKDIRAASETLLSIVNNILDISKIEKGKFTLTSAEYDLRELINNILKQMRFELKGKNISLDLEMDEALPTRLYGDDNHLRRVLVNLISNGIKYTQEGSVKLKVSGRTEGKEAILDFAVSDTGIGIQQQDLKKLFEKFERIEEKRNRSIEGAGLGLNITVGILTLMKSQLNVQSEYGVGSTFSFTIRQNIVDAKPSTEKTTNAANVSLEKFAQKFTAPSARILLVDDNSINRLVVKKLLKKSEVQIDEAANGLQCLERFKENTYDIILLDHMMPEMDGIEAMQELKKLAKYQEEQPFVVALTANAIVGVREEYLQAGFDYYLSKPIVPAQLDELIIKNLPKDKVIIESL